MPTTPAPMRRRTWLQAAGLSAALASLGGRSALAQSWPSRPVKILVGSAPGGPSDFMSRIMSDAVAPTLGQPFVIENKPGASGMPAADQVAKATPDGHTLLATGPASIVVVPHLFPKLPYNPQTDLVPVTMLGAGAFVLVAHPSLGISSVQELIALARAKPGSIAYASGGNGSSGHLGTELFCQQTGIQMTHVPYKGDGAALPDLLSGQVQVMFTAPNVPMAQVKAGRLKLLAVTTRERVSSMPDTPSVHEAGVKDFEYLGWICIFAPARTPQAVIDQLHAAWNKARQVPAVRDKLEGLAMYAPERYSSREALQAFLRAEGTRLGKVIRDANVKAEG